MSQTSSKFVWGIVILSALVGIVLIGYFYFFSNSDSAKNTEKVFTIGIINPGGEAFDKFISGFLSGMDERGYKSGENVLFDVRKTQGDGDLIPVFADELIANNVDMLVLMAGPSTKYALSKTKTIPILTILGAPEHHGYVETIKRSGKNLSGIAHTNIELTPKRIELLKELDPEINNMAVFYDTTCGPTEIYRPVGIDIATKLGVKITEFALTIPTAEETDIAIETALSQGEFDSILFYPHSTLFKYWDIFAEKAQKYGIPIIAPEEANISKGRAIASYGADYFKAGKQLSRQAEKVLTGSPISEIPFETPNQITYVINLTNADLLGINPNLDALRRADDVVRR